MAKKRKRKKIENKKSEKENREQIKNYRFFKGDVVLFFSLPLFPKRKNCKKKFSN
jgi:hypothetical protein